MTQGRIKTYRLCDRRQITPPLCCLPDAVGTGTSASFSGRRTTRKSSQSTTGFDGLILSCLEVLRTAGMGSFGWKLRIKLEERGKAGGWLRPSAGSLQARPSCFCIRGGKNWEGEPRVPVGPPPPLSLGSRGPCAWFNALEVHMMIERGSPRCHRALGPANYVADPASTFRGLLWLQSAATSTKQRPWTVTKRRQRGCVGSSEDPPGLCRASASVGLADRLALNKDGSDSLVSFGLNAPGPPAQRSSYATGMWSQPDVDANPKPSACRS